MKYAAFLRGVNVGGKGMIKMADLKVLLEGLGYTDVQTILTSGNAIFTAEKGTLETITRKIESALTKKYKREVTVMLRTIDELVRSERQQPFKGIDIKPTTKLYVTFMYEPSRGVRIPDPDTNFKIVRIKDMDAFSVLELSDEMDTTASMTKLAKIFGPKITMRNWNTVLKVIRAATEEPKKK